MGRGEDVSSYSWYRRRERAEQLARERADDEHGDNPWVEADQADRARPTEDASARYEQWAERLRAKRARAQATYAGTQDPSTATYWTTDSVFRESERVEQQELGTQTNPWRVVELLGVLDLREGATPDEVTTAYRRLAKAHHPDRFAEADESVRAFHDERMRAINAAYRSLRELERA